jgi:hypothetical protein
LVHVPGLKKGRRSRRRILACLILTVAFGLSIAGSASAWRLYSVYHWDLYTTVTNSPIGAISHDGDELNSRYAWTVDMAHSSRVSYNACFDYSYFESVDIAAHDTAERHFTHDLIWVQGDCVVVRGKSLYGTQYNRNGYALI